MPYPATTTSNKPEFPRWRGTLVLVACIAISIIALRYWIPEHEDIPPPEPPPPEPRTLEQTPLTDLLGMWVTNRDGEMTPVNDLAGGLIGIYFSAQWNPACRFFTNHLLAFYDQMQQQGKPFEVVLVSWDRSENDLFIYMRDYEMPWKAISWQAPQRMQLARTFNIHRIPELIIVNDQGHPLSRDGRNAIMNHPERAYRQWSLQ